MKNGGGNRYYLLLGILILVFCSSQTVLAEQGSDLDLSALQQTIEGKKRDISTINAQIDEYKQKISEKESEKTTLANQLDILQNRIGKTETEIEETHLEIDLVTAEISETEQELMSIELMLDEHRLMILHVLQRMQTEDAHLPLQIFYSSKNFSDFFDTIEQLQQINADLKRSVDESKLLKQQSDEKLTLQLAKHAQLDDLKITLENEKMRLNDEAEAKTLLVSNAYKTESLFQKLLTDLKQEQIFVQDQVQELQTQLEQKIKPSDAINGGLLSWPVNPYSRGISAGFHDPTYPFRNLFEHSGIDLPALVGTPVTSAAAGYVAWARKGTQYGNYVMIIHSDGIATLYAHLSHIDVVPDQFVNRGEQIGAIGMTGFTTGPHLHLEVRKNGIPSNPLSFLPSL